MKGFLNRGSKSDQPNQNGDFIQKKKHTMLSSLHFWPGGFFMCKWWIYGASGNDERVFVNTASDLIQNQKGVQKMSEMNLKTSKMSLSPGTKGPKAALVKVLGRIFPWIIQGARN
jgi:hypothetical protein